VARTHASTAATHTVSARPSRRARTAVGSSHRLPLDAARTRRTVRRSVQSPKARSALSPITRRFASTQTASVRVPHSASARTAFSSGHGPVVLGSRRRPDVQEFAHDSEPRAAKRDSGVLGAVAAVPCRSVLTRSAATPAGPQTRSIARAAVPRPAVLSRRSHPTEASQTRRLRSTPAQSPRTASSDVAVRCRSEARTHGHSSPSRSRSSARSAGASGDPTEDGRGGAADFSRRKNLQK